MSVLLVIFLLASLLGVGAVGVIAGAAIQRRTHHVLDHLSSELAHTYRLRSNGDLAWDGELAERPLRIRGATALETTSFAVQVRELPYDLALSMGTAVKGQARTGDKELDQHWVVGSRGGGIGRLQPMARTALERIRSRCSMAKLVDGVFTVNCTAEHLLDVLLCMRTLIPLLEGEPVDLLADRAQNDPSPRVRAQMLWELAQHDRERATAVAKARDIHQPWSPEELVIMGDLLQQTATLQRALDHEATGLALASRAARSLLRMGADPSAIIGAMAERQGMPGVREVAQAISDTDGIGAADLLPYLRAVAKRTQTRDPRTREQTISAILRVLEAHPPARVEEALLHTLPLTAGAVRVRTIEALGAVGSVAAVAPMRQQQAERPRADFVTRSAFDKAIARIQARTHGDVGALALAEVAEGVGTLAIAEAAVTVATPTKPTITQIMDPEAVPERRGPRRKAPEG